MFGKGKGRLHSKAAKAILTTEIETRSCFVALSPRVFQFYIFLITKCARTRSWKVGEGASLSETDGTEEEESK